MKTAGNIIRGRHSEFKLGCGGLILLMSFVMALLVILLMSSGIM